MHSLKFHSSSVEEHEEVPLADEGRWEAVVEQFTPSRPEGTPTEGAACYVVSVGSWRSPEHQRAQLEEILGLVEAHGDTVVGHESHRLLKPDPRTWLGRGACESIAERARTHGATVLVLDAPLSPSQTRNLEDLTGLSVSDREVVILGVFLKHARSRTARIQVEIAHLEYLRPRIRGLGLDMDQQAGGVMNGKGAGETASELLARQLDDRLVKLRRTLVKLERADAVRRRRRDACERIALVGYTNAGKTSLMNGLTGASLSTRSRPFETLDTTSRCLTRHGGEVLVGDTVGFIRDLPQRLLASFATTLAEAAEASLLALVVDLSDPEWSMHLDTTSAQLEAIGAGAIPRFLVFNKADRVDRVPWDEVREACGTHPFRVLSSLDASAVDELRDALVSTVRAGSERAATVFVPYADGALTAEIYARCRVVASEATDDGLRLEIEGPARAVDRILARVEAR
ncbi:MAG: GTPase HflX [Myxococcota bacterium]